MFSRTSALGYPASSRPLRFLTLYGCKPYPIFAINRLILCHISSLDSTEKKLIVLSSCSSILKKIVLVHLSLDRGEGRGCWQKWECTQVAMKVICMAGRGAGGGDPTGPILNFLQSQGYGGQVEICKTLAWGQDLKYLIHQCKIHIPLTYLIF